MRKPTQANTATDVGSDLSSRAAVDRFRKEAAAFTARATRSKKAARDILIAEGIYTKSGQLAKHYR